MSGIEIKPDGVLAGAAATKPAPGAAAAKPTVPITMEKGGWPIVHGNVQSADHTEYKAPLTKGPALTFATSQSIEDKQTGLAQMLMTTMLGASQAPAGGGLRSLATQASALLGFSLADANPVSVITEKRPDGTTILWTSTIRNVLAYKVSGSELELVAEYDHGYNFRFHGSYAFVGQVNGKSHFFTTDNDSLVAYVLNEKAGKFTITPTGKLALPIWVNPNKTDHLVGVTVLADGTVVVGSKTGVLMAIRSDGKGGFVLMDTLNLGDFTRTSNNEVSNSISSDGEQGIYIVTQREMARVDFDATTGRLGFKWSTIYGGPEPEWFVGRLGPGSGSTPSITECKGRKMVVITDGALPMNVMWYDALTGVLAGQRKVQFTADENGNLPTTSEQSVAVDGCKAFVVQNYMGKTSLDDDVFCTTAPAQGIVRDQIPEICRQLLPFNSSDTDLFLSRACPPALGCYSLGAATYEINPDLKEANGEGKVTRNWARSDMSCGTTIPLISKKAGSNAVYCVGADEGGSQWTLMGLDMDSGKTVLNYQFYKEFGARNIFINPFYAGVEAIGDNQIVIGSVGGIVLVTPATGVSAKFRSLSADFSNEMQQGVSSIMHGDLKNISVPVGATLIAAGLAILALLAVVLRRGHAVMSPRLPTRN